MDGQTGGSEHYGFQWCHIANGANFLRHLNIVHRITVSVVKRELGRVVGLAENVQPVVKVPGSINKGGRQCFEQLVQTGIEVYVVSVITRGLEATIIKELVGRCVSNV